MKALVFAAGYGNRLRPLTDTIPKPLIEVNGKTVLQRVIERLAAAGVGCSCIGASCSFSMGVAGCVCRL